jgi:hypothetical protein
MSWSNHREVAGCWDEFAMVGLPRVSFTIIEMMLPVSALAGQAQELRHKT